MNGIPAIVIALVFATAVSSCSLPRHLSHKGDSGQAPVDFAIITVLPEEYHAVLRKLENVHEVMDPARQPNVYLWVVGEIRPADSGDPYRVVLAMAGEAGEVSGALATNATLDHWKPRDVFLVGIAGGIDPFVALGDVMISSQIWGYEHGHLGQRFDSGGLVFFQPDPILLEEARNLDSTWKERIGRKPPLEGTSPRVVVGNTASGNKVIESDRSPYFAQSVQLNESILSVDMEGAGAAAAMRRDQDLGGTRGFLMIRGISDVVASKVQADGAVRGRNPQRGEWKEYAADVAASFAISLIASKQVDR
jgi:nucleoside phosphorylase